MQTGHFFYPTPRAARFITLLIAIIAVLLAIQFSIEKINHPTVTHALSPAETSTKVIWLINNFSDQMISNGNMLFVIADSGKKLVAVDPMTGEIIWKANRLNGHQGAGNLRVYKDVVIVSSSTAIDAYDLKNGELLWTTFLGDGHVSIILQVDGEILRVYYGDYIYEINPLTGTILSKSNKENIMWTLGDVQIRKVDNCNIEALDNKGGKLIWKQCYSLRVADETEPQQLTEHNSLIVHLENGWLCSINLEDGSQKWCVQNVHMSNAAIDFESNRIYILREDFTLIEIDALTGATQNEINFLTNIEINEVTYGRVVYSKNSIVVYFADSEQTYGLNIEKIAD